MNTCFNLNPLPHIDTALQTILADLIPLTGYEIIDIANGKGRILAAPIHASFSTPPFDNAAVDGFALHKADIEGIDTLKLPIAGTSYAGTPYTAPIKAGQCIRVMTGARLPEATSSVIMQENAVFNEQSMTFQRPVLEGQNIRKSGEDILQGQMVIAAGKCLNAHDIGLIASLGICEIQVKRKLRVAVISSGDELIPFGTEKNVDSIYDSNRFSLMAALDKPEIQVQNMGICPDMENLLIDRFLSASRWADLILCTGGVSTGTSDYTRQALNRIGSIRFWKTALKPGKPLAFGKIGSAHFFGLPGNPVAAMVSLYMFVLPAIDQLLSVTQRQTPPLLSLPVTQSIRKKTGRTEVICARIQTSNDGSLSIAPSQKQGSAMLSSLADANAFIILEHERGTVQIGETVKVHSFAAWF